MNIRRSSQKIVRTYSSAFEFDCSVTFVSVVLKNKICELWNIMFGVTLSGDEKISVFILGKPLQPINQESIRISSRSSIPAFGIISCHI